MKSPIIVFDLDGTLIDTAPDLLDSLNHCLGTVGLKCAEAADFRSILGHGGRALIERAFAAQRRDLSLSEHDRLYDLFLSHYGENIPGRSAPYAGVPAALGRLRAAGYRMAICTNKTEAFSQRLISQLGMSDLFAAICGADTFAYRKPDPRHLLSTIEDAGGDPARAVMVGDSRTDIDTAKAAGIPVVAVDFGYTDRHVREFEPSRVISSFDELTVDLTEHLIRAAEGKSGS